MRGWIKSNSIRANRHWQSGNGKSGGWDIIPRVSLSALNGYSFNSGVSFLQGIGLIQTSYTGRCNARYTYSTPTYTDLISINRDGGVGRNIKRGTNGNINLRLINNIVGKDGLELYFAALLFHVKYTDNSYKIFYTGEGFYNQQSLSHATNFDGSYSDADVSISISGTGVNFTVPTWPYSKDVSSKSDFTGTVDRTGYDAEAGVNVSISFGDSVQYVSLYGFCVGTNAYTADLYNYDGLGVGIMPVLSSIDGQSILMRYKIT